MLDIGYAYLVLAIAYLAVALATLARMYCKCDVRRRRIEKLAGWLHVLLAIACLFVALHYLWH